MYARPGRPAIGPTALALLADTVTRHLGQRERFTLYLDYRAWTRSYLRRSAALQAQEGAQSLIDAIQARAHRPSYRVQTIDHNRFSLVVRFVPDNEWHPSPADAPGAPLTVFCDASVADGQARGGIATGKEAVTLDLAATQCTRSSDAELLTLCLAMLTAADQRSPLTVYADETEAVHAAQLLRDGQIPPWVYRHGDDLVQRITVAAMTASRLRSVTIVHLPRDQVAAAHAAAYAGVPHEHMLSPRTWAARQGIGLSWIDAQRGLDRDAPSKPLFQSRTEALRTGPLWS
jgi:hypothetical protein